MTNGTASVETIRTLIQDYMRLQSVLDDLEKSSALLGDTALQETVESLSNSATELNDRIVKIINTKLEEQN